MKKKAIFFLTISFYTIRILSQTLSFSYDPSGNRISKTAHGNTPIVTLTGDTAICAGESVQLNASGGIGYAWSTGQNQPSILVSPLVSQYYKVTVTGVNGCTTTDSVFVLVNPIPVVAAINGPSIIESYSQGLVYNAEAHPGSTYQWTVAGGQILSGQGGSEITVSWGKSGGLVTVVESSAFGCQSAQKVIQVSSTITQTISLQSGWNLMSVYVEPANMAPESVFGPILPWVTQVKNMNQFYIPTYPPQFNTLKFLTNGSGYWVNLTQAKSLNVTGTWLNNDYVGINLSTGWNLKGYIGESLQGLEGALNSIWSNLIEVRSANKFYVKGYPPQFNTLQYLKPGEGYWIKVSANCAFNYPNPTDQGTDFTVPVNNDYCWQPVRYTNSTVCWGKVTYKGLPLRELGNPEETIIGAFVNGECREASPVFSYNNETFVNLMIGSETPEPVSFYLKYKGRVLGTNYVFQTIPGEAIQDFLPLEFGNYATSQETNDNLFKNGILPANTLVVFPNPFNKNTTLSLELAQDSPVIIKIHDLTTGRFETIADSYFAAGAYSFDWNGKFDGKDVAPGIYLVTVNSVSFNIQQKIIKY